MLLIITLVSSSLWWLPPTQHPIKAVITENKGPFYDAEALYLCVYLCLPLPLSMVSNAQLLSLNLNSELE